jgi:hypothetical protein
MADALDSKSDDALSKPSLSRGAKPRSCTIIRRSASTGKSHYPKHLSLGVHLASAGNLSTTSDHGRLWSFMVIDGDLTPILWAICGQNFS